MSDIDKITSKYIGEERIDEFSAGAWDVAEGILLYKAIAAGVVVGSVLTLYIGALVSKWFKHKKDLKKLGQAIDDGREQYENLGPKEKQWIDKIITKAHKNKQSVDSALNDIRNIISGNWTVDDVNKRAKEIGLKDDVLNDE